MLAMTLAATLLAQGPADEMVLAGGGGGRADALVVEGTIELSRAEAETAALQAARDARRDRIRARGEELAAAHAGFWVPSFVVDREVAHWAGRAERDGSLRVLDRDTTVHRYSYGDAYQTTLRVVPDKPTGRGGEKALERRLQDAGRLFLAKCGGIAMFWGLLAFLQSWFDRLSRGYMTWRLRFLALGLGLVVPPIVLLI